MSPLRRADESLSIGDSDWQRKGGTLSDKTACEEFGLTYARIVKAIRAGHLQYREGSIYGNPYFRLLRSEVEALVARDHGDAYLADRRTSTELVKIDRELRRMKSEMKALEARKGVLFAEAATQAQARGVTPAPVLPPRGKRRTPSR